VIESNTSLGGLTLDPAGMHCPAGDDGFVSSYKMLLHFLQVKVEVTKCVEGNCTYAHIHSMYNR